MRRGVYTEWSTRSGRWSKVYIERSRCSIIRVRRRVELLMDEEPPEVTDIGAERVKRRAPDLHVVCPRCGKSNFMRDTRCQHCGLWFQGEAFQFAPSESVRSRKRRVLLLLVWFGFAVLLVLAIAVVIAVLRP